MNELPIFLSYRKDDAAELARWIHGSLIGRTLLTSDGTLQVPRTLSVYLDESASPVENWRTLLEESLKRARVLILICSPGAATEFDNDVLYFELRWWITHRQSAPILITPSGQRWIPPPITERWPDAQTINISSQDQAAFDRMNGTGVLTLPVERILKGIASKLGDVGSEEGSGSLQAVNGLNMPHLFTWEKDKYFRYITCNENYARAAGFDSPGAMVGKSDDDMPWRLLADYFRQGDQRVMNAESPSRQHVQEKEIMIDRVADILVTENQLETADGDCVGVLGYFVDITGMQLVPANSLHNTAESDYNLGPEFGNQSFSPIEADVLKGVLRKFSDDRIASALTISKAEVKLRLASIKHKMQCTTTADVRVAALRSGLPLRLFGLK